MKHARRLWNGFVFVGLPALLTVGALALVVAVFGRVGLLVLLLGVMGVLLLVMLYLGGELYESRQ